MIYYVWLSNIAMTMSRTQKQRRSGFVRLAACYWLPAKRAWYVGRVCIFVRIVCLHTLENLDEGCSYSHMGVFPGNTGQVRIWRSSGQVQGHRSQKGLKSLFPQCKTSIGNIKHKAMNFACSMEFSTTAERTVWPPSLSRDRKWPHARIRSWSCIRFEGILFVIKRAVITAWIMRTVIYRVKQGILSPY